MQGRGLVATTSHLGGAAETFEKEQDTSGLAFVSAVRSGEPQAAALMQLVERADNGDFDEPEIGPHRASFESAARMANFFHWHDQLRGVHENELGEQPRAWTMGDAMGCQRRADGELRVSRYI